MSNKKALSKNKCEICNKLCKGLRGLSSHVTKLHKISSEQYYKIYLNSLLIRTIKNKYNNILKLEKTLHTTFNSYCKVQPKSSGAGRTEWFDSAILPKVIKFIDHPHQ